MPKGYRRQSALLCEHQGLIHVAEMANFALGSLEPHLKLILDGLEISRLTGSYMDRSSVRGNRRELV